MAIDTKSIQHFLWKALSFSMKTCYDIVEKYPKTSSVSISVFLLYIFFPLVLIFFICSLFVTAIAVVVYRVYFRADLEGFENVRGYKKTDEKQPPIFKDNGMGKNVISVSSQSETTRRRNVNEKDRGSYYAQSSIEDKDVVCPAGLNDDLVDKSAVVEENLKEIREVNVYSSKKKAGPSSTPQASQIVASPPFTSGCLEATHFSGVKAETEGESSDDSEEDAREDRNKAVEWNVDDQMNLSHVGNIEIERNTRLENLIARRKARKLLDIQVRNTLMRPATTDSRDCLPSIITARKNHFLSSNSEMSPIPGSAPSVLLPMHKSPFDISFDPDADKPISSGDSFQKEILADQQKEATFCRHESFGRGSFSPIKSLQDRKVNDFSFHHGLPEKSETSRTGYQSESTQENEENGSEVEKKQIVHEKINERPRSSSSMEENVPWSGANKDKLLQSLSSLAQKDMDADRDDNVQEIDVSYNTDRLLYEKTEGNSFFGEKRMCHAPSNSLASDLQVEVSEVGSPQSTSSNEKSYIFDDYINKEVTSGSEDMLADSSGGVDMNESNTREVNEVSEQDITDAGFSSINHNLDPNTSDLQPEKLVRQEEISSHSQPSNLPESIQGQITDVKPDHLTPSDSTDAPSTNDSEHSTKEVVAHTSASANLEEASPEEVNVIDESVIHNNDGNENLKSRKVIEPEAVAEFSAPVANIKSESLEDTFVTPNKDSYLNTSNTSDQNKKSSVPISNGDDSSASQNITTQDREEGNVNSHNNKPVTIENEANTKSESVKDSESKAEMHVDLVEPSNPMNSKSSQDTDENVIKIVGDGNAVDTSKATEEIKNIDSDVKTKELQKAEPQKEISQHMAADGKDNSETIKVVESESRTSTPMEAVVASKQFDLNDDTGKTMGHMEVKEQLDPHQGNSTVECNIISDDNETVISTSDEKEIKPTTGGT